MRILFLALALVALVGCSVGGPSQAEVKKVVDERQQALTQFKSEFEPLHTELLTELKKPDYGSSEVLERLESKFDNLKSKLPNNSIHDTASLLVSHDSFVANQGSLYHSPCLDDQGLKASTRQTMDKALAETKPYEKLETFASEERVHKELSAKPIPPEQIKIGAKVTNADTGKLIGVITNPEYHKDEEILVVVATDPNRAEETKLFLSRFEVGRGIDFKVEGP